MEYRNPLIIKLSDKSSRHPDNQFSINAKQPWNAFKKDVKYVIDNSEFDYIAVTYDKDLLENASLQSLSIQTNEIAKAGTALDVPVMNRYNNQMYRLNARYDHGSQYVAPNDEVLNKFRHFAPEGQPDDAWQKHQAKVWDNISKVSPLNDGSYGENHTAILTAPSRGLSEDDISSFFTMKNGMTIVPGIVNDDMIGMPAVNARISDDQFYFKDRLLSDHSLSLTLMGSGYTIPMRNEHGDMAKFQVGADVTAFNTKIKASAPDGVSIQSSEIFDKKSRTYKFKLEDGTDAKLKVVSANNKAAVFEDVHGQFQANIKADIKDTLIERGYQMPELIDKLSVVPNAKYAWPAPGNMVGTKTKELDIPKLVSPSEAGFIPVRESQNGQYTVIVVEGALKGHITASYLGKEDMQHVTNEIAGENGLIVAQVPGVSKAFLDSVPNIKNTYNVSDFVVAMDADGRYNKSVARGIHDAVRILGNTTLEDGVTNTPTRVMSWNPDQKGIDDALLAIHRKEITMDDFGLTFGTAEELFPLDQAKAPNPYRLDGTRANRLDWQIEYTEDVQKRQTQKQEIQEKSSEILSQVSSNQQVNDTSSVETDNSPSVENSSVTIPEIVVEPSDATKISDKVKAGELTQDDIDEFLQGLSDLATEMNNRITEFANK